MKAVVVTQYGLPADVLQVREVATPEPGHDEALIRLYASSVNPLDDFTIKGPLFFFPQLGRLLKTRHKIPGADYAGRIESVGRDIKQFQPGEEVFGAAFQGGFAQYVCARESNFARKPSNLSFEQAAAVPVAAITALQGLRDHGQIQPGQRVLVDGASGGVGTFAVQIAKYFGAEVTAVCSPGNVAQAEALGAHRVIDYTVEDFTRSKLRYDLILGVNAHHPIFHYRRVLTRDGTFVMVGGHLGLILQAFLLRWPLSAVSKKRMSFFIAKINQADLLLLKNLLEAETIAPVIDRQYPLAEVAEALRYRGEGHAKGKVVISIPHNE